MRHPLPRIVIYMLFAGTLAIAAAAENAPGARLDAIVDEYLELRRQGGVEWPGGGSGATAPDLSPESFLGRIQQRRELLARVRSIETEALTPPERTDQRVLIALLESSIYDADRRRSWETQPSLYLPVRQISRLFGAEEGSIDEERATALLRSVAPAAAQGRKSLQRPTEKATRETIFQTQQTVEALREGQERLVEEAARAAASEALSAAEAYLTFLEKDLLPRSDGQWAIGREHYDYTLKHRWLMDEDADDIIAFGKAAFERTIEELQGVADRMAPGKDWIEVYESLKDDHPEPDRLKASYQAQMDAAKAFVAKYKVVTLPEGEEVITVDTPPAMRRSSPYGTFDGVDPDQEDKQGRLVLTPIDDSLPPEQRAERLRAHHHSWIPIIAVHEAYPGHHVQMLKSYENPRKLRHHVRESIFSEGWGLYTEKLMFELGFLQGDDVKLTQLRNRLWREARVILDASLHTGKMTFEEAVDFMVENVRFDRVAAELEVGIYVRFPTYVLGYRVGMAAIEEMREAWVAKHGEPSEPRELWDRLLSIGALPPVLVRAELLADGP